MSTSTSRPSRLEYKENPQKNASYKRRRKNHDYRKPGTYMITMAINKQATPFLSSISGDPELMLKNNFSQSRNYAFAPTITLTDAGKLVDATLNKLPQKFPQIILGDYIIMPDHIHFLLIVTDNLPQGLGQSIAHFSGLCTSTFRNNYPQSSMATEKLSFFEPNFNDSIIYNRDKKLIYSNYIKDNSRRYLLKKHFKDFYFRQWVLEYDAAEIIQIVHTIIAAGGYPPLNDLKEILTQKGFLKGDRFILHLRGNILLLENPFKHPLRMSSKFSPAELARRAAAWEECARCQGVIVSPFINTREKDARYNYQSQGASIIKIEANGFSEKNDTKGSDFELCSEGRLLRIAPPIYETEKEKSKLSRNYSLFLNALAYIIATRPGTPRQIPLR